MILKFTYLFFRNIRHNCSLVFLCLLLSFIQPVLFSSEANAMQETVDLGEDERFKETEEKIEGLYQKVITDNRLLNKLDSSYRFEYPVGIQAGNGDLNYSIILDQDKVTTGGLFLSAYMRFEIPGNGKVIMFKADGIHLSRSGGLVGDVNIHLVGKKKIKIIKGINMYLDGESTYATFDCSGFKSFTLGGTIEFSPDFIISEDPLTGNKKPDKIVVSFNQSMTDWNDMLFSFSISPFQFKAFPHFGFEVTNAVIDLSDTRNAEGMVFPAKYKFSDEVNSNVNLWRGIYIKTAVIRIPDLQGKKQRPTLSGTGMIIDDLGFTGSVTSSNLIPLNKGNVGGWAFSLDQISIDFVNSSLTKGSALGKISLPIAKEGESVNYSAIIDANGDFSFTASSPKSINVPCFVAQMTIDASSKITIQKKDDNYIAAACLNGVININAPMGKNDTTGAANGNPQGPKGETDGFSVSNLKFQGLTLSSVAPYFNMGTWSVNSIGYKDKANGFELTISNIHTTEDGLEKGLEFTCSLGLMPGKYSATAVIAINGKMDISKNPDGTVNRHKWKYSGTEVKEIYVKCKDDVLSLDGYFASYNHHDVYGDGMSGAITAIILPSSLNVQLAASAIFGNLNKTRYWYFDALVAFKTGIAMGPMSLYGFGGGAYYHMKRSDGDVILKEEKVDLTGSNIGVTASGLRYVPDEYIGLGLKATIIIGLSGDPKPFNGDATLEIAFNTKGGVNNVGFLGNGYLMSEITIGKPRADAPLKASIDINYDFPNKTLHGVLAITVNAAKGIIQGSGKLELHFDPSKWYIYVGTPQSRISLTANLLGLVKVNTTAYFVIGTVLPPFAEPDPEVLGILKIKYDKPENSRAITGKGFAFGMSYSYTTPRLKLAIFYAQFGIGMGFDVMLANYGKNTICVETNETIGMNGWYAMGQAYAYVKGDIGASVKFLGKRYEKRILYIAAAVLLEAQLPNPTWLRGTVGGEWELFGGMISGNCRFQVELGTKCTMKSTGGGGAGSALEGMDIISALTPESGRTGVDVFANPQVVFNYKIGQEFEVTDENNKTFSVRIVNDYFKITASGKDIAGEYKWNSRNDVYVFTPADILPGTTKIDISAKVHFEENTGGGWHTVTSEGKAVEQSLASSFTTGKAPDYIPENNISCTYPIKDQLNFLKSEYEKGYVQLIKGQPYLFSPGAEWSQVAKFIPVKEGSSISNVLSYDATAKTVNFDIPSGLSNETIYKLNLANVPKSTTAIDKNITQKAEDKDVSSDAKVTMKKQEAEGTLSVLEEKSLFEQYFRTSKYNTFKDKLESINKTNFFLYQLVKGYFILTSGITLPEPLDPAEFEILIFYAGEEGLWLKNEIKPKVYNNYPIVACATISYRDVSDLGLVPIKAINLNLESVESLKEDEKKTGIYSIRNQEGNLRYSLSYYSLKDYNEIKSKIANSGISNTKTYNYIQSAYPSNTQDDYPIKVDYILPHTNIKTSTSTIYVKYF